MFKPGNLLYLVDGALWTTDGTTSSLVTNLNNNAAGFTQLNETHVVVSVSNDHCLLIVNRYTNQATEYAGSCGQEGNRVGQPLSNNRFSYPSHDIIKDVENPKNLIFTDQNTGPMDIKVLESEYDNTYSAYRPTNPQEFSLSLTQDTWTKELFFSALRDQDNDCSIYGLRNGNLTCVSGYNFRNINQMALINNGKQMLVLDDWEMKVLDLATGAVTVVCRGFRYYNDEICQHNALSMAVVGDKLYLGTDDKILEVKGKCILSLNYIYSVQFQYRSKFWEHMSAK